MNVASIEIGLDLDEDCSPGFLDGKMRISVEDDTVCIFVNRKKNGTAYVLADLPLGDFRSLLVTLGVFHDNDA